MKLEFDEVAPDLAGDPDAEDPQSEAGVIMGTPRFIAPEVLRGPAADERLDIYALGGSGTNAAFRTTFPTPGLAGAVAIHQGLAYVADGTAGEICRG